MNRLLFANLILSAANYGIDPYPGVRHSIHRGYRNGVPVCVKCEREIPPGKAGRKCKSCRVAKVTT